VKQIFHAEYRQFGHMLLPANQEERWDHFVSQILIASRETFAGNCPPLMTKCVLKNTTRRMAHNSSGTALSTLSLTKSQFSFTDSTVNQVTQWEDQPMLLSVSTLLPLLFRQTPTKIYLIL
jgi:hypothetical protein